MYQELREKLGKNKDLVDEFFYTFMRFEFALKSSGFLNGVNANWDKFALEIKSKFNPGESKELQEAVDFILNNRPEKQINSNDTLTFQDDTDNANYITCNLKVYIKRVRNNLFHGAKFSGQDETQLTRDFALIRASLHILKEWSQLIPEVREKFEQPIS